MSSRLITVRLLSSLFGELLLAYFSMARPMTHNSMSTSSTRKSTSTTTTRTAYILSASSSNASSTPFSNTTATEPTEPSSESTWPDMSDFTTSVPMSDVATSGSFQAILFVTIGILLLLTIVVALVITLVCLCGRNKKQSDTISKWQLNAKRTLKSIKSHKPSKRSRSKQSRHRRPSTTKQMASSLKCNKPSLISNSKRFQIPSSIARKDSQFEPKVIVPQMETVIGPPSKQDPRFGTLDSKLCITLDIAEPSENSNEGTSDPLPCKQDDQAKIAIKLKDKICKSRNRRTTSPALTKWSKRCVKKPKGRGRPGHAQ